MPNDWSPSICASSCSLNGTRIITPGLDEVVREAVVDDEDQMRKGGAVPSRQQREPLVPVLHIPRLKQSLAVVSGLDPEILDNNIPSVHDFRTNATSNEDYDLRHVFDWHA